MQIKELKIFTHQLTKEKAFYSNVLGFETVTENEMQFTVKVGWSMLTFVQSLIAYKYHYCFMIPANKIKQALAWISTRLAPVNVEDGGTIAHHDSWNADSFYYYDGSGNIAEFIVRYDLKNDTSDNFTINSIVCLNEIGIGTNDVGKIIHQLETEIGAMFWKGDKERFATVGTQEGLFLVPNYDIKSTWYPTEVKVMAAPFEAIIRSGGSNYFVAYNNGNITTKVI